MYNEIHHAQVLREPLYAKKAEWITTLWWLCLGPPIQINKRNFWIIEKDVEELFKPALSCRDAQNIISWRAITLTDFQSLGQDIISQLLNTAVFTAPSTKLVERQTKQTVMNEDRFYDPGTIVSKKDAKTSPLWPLMGIPFVPSSIFKHVKQKCQRGRIKSSISSGFSCKKCESGYCSSRDRRYDHFK